MSAEDLLKDQYFDDIWENSDIARKASKRVEADLNFFSTREALQFLMNEKELLKSEI